MDSIFDNLKDSFKDLNKLKGSLLSSSMNAINELEKIKASSDIPEEMKKDFEDSLTEAQKKINEFKALTNGN
jgi:hypothetical protein